MSRREMEHLKDEELESVKLENAYTSHEVFLAEMILINRNEKNTDDEFYLWYNPKDDEFYNGYFGYPERGDVKCRINKRRSNQYILIRKSIKIHSQLQLKITVVEKRS